MGQRIYHYVGPSDVRESVLSHSPVGTAIRSGEELVAWLTLQATDRERDGALVATFVISLEGLLLLAPRRSEHMPVRAA